MSQFINIQTKLQQFYKRFYLNELIKGLLLFFSIGCLYLIFTLFIEHFFWLKPLARTILFWLFIIVELVLIFTYISIPLVKLSGLKKGITDTQAAKIIGNHFPEISDKLLNIIQLKQIHDGSELIEASIEQKAKQLQPIPFKKAINFNKNKKYIKYALLPILIWLLTLITGNIAILNSSFSRVVHHNTPYEPPAPFLFNIANTSLRVIENQPFTLQVEIIGNTLPEDVIINFNNENYYLENKGFGKFEYTFSNIKESLNFYLEANGVVSKKYKITSIETPIINNLKLVLNYPAYTRKKNEILQNTGNAIVPQGTNISWQIETQKTSLVKFIRSEMDTVNFEQPTENYFSFSKQILNPLNYQITTSNLKLSDYESLNFNIQVITDQYPKIEVTSNIDSITIGPVHFYGQLTDDYGIQKLQLIYYDKNNINSRKTHPISISKSLFTDFYYIFPDGIEIEEGVTYEFYFEVFDNDAIHGSKKTKSRVFSYYNKTQNELKESLLNNQKVTINKIANTLKSAKENNKEAKEFKDELQKKSEVNWNDTKKLKEFLKRQNQYQEMFEKQTTDLEKNLNEQPENERLKEQREDLKNRIQEAKELVKKEKLLEELDNLTKKLTKENLVDKLKDIAKKNQQKEKSLERILELMKRFYVEQKASQISQNLEELSTKEKELSSQQNEDNTATKQQEINDDFKKIKSEFKELLQQNSNLIRPMKIPNSTDEIQEINTDLEKALDNLEKNNPTNAQKNQKRAAKNMKALSKKLGASMSAMQGEQIDENIDDLRIIVENLIEFSFQQEALMDKFSSTDFNQADYPNNLKEQFILKEYFEHIDDSLYLLSLRLFKMSSVIQKEVSEVHYYLNESLTNFTDNKFNIGVSNQQFVITSANNLADVLSDLLESLMNASSSMGKGNGNSKDFALPDIIQKQGELSEKVKNGSSKKKGSDKIDSESESQTEQLNEELYEIYKQQSQLRNALQQILKKGTSKGSNKAKEVLKSMEELEAEILENGFSDEVLKKMQQINYELLKLDEAKEEQGEDKERESVSNYMNYKQRVIDQLKLQHEYKNYNEILNRQSLPLRSIYKNKVQEYFKIND
ncbi:DUF4175 family protein [Lutibacter sp.]|uniref:DUF4175 family protein n=1 Tax=Lutibacter sp. TaxID=1925666 RepID=UPI00356172A7